MQIMPKSALTVENTIIVFCDGACTGNPGPGGWGSIIATPQGQVYELGGFAPHTTNNQMEITAAIKALDRLATLHGEISIFTDSTYLIRGITQWVLGWKRRGWKTAEGKDVLNRKLWEDLSQVVEERGKKNPISWKHIRGHQGIPGNERADEIAVSFAKSKSVDLYRGPLIKYHTALYDFPETTDLPEMKPKKSKGGKPYSYVSLLGGIPARHSSWADCEARVSGVSGAKFKKAMSEEEEKRILKSWGCD